MQGWGSRVQVTTPAKSSKKAVDSHNGPKLRPARLARGNMLNCSAPARASWEEAPGQIVC